MSDSTEASTIINNSQKEQRPVYTMDIMRLVGINDFIKTADYYYISLEAGNRQMIIPLFATIKVLWRKLKRFYVTRYPEKVGAVSKLITEVETSFNFDKPEDNEEEDFFRAKKGLILILETLDEVIDEIFVKFYEITPENEKAWAYALGRA
jgi:hypothetical protein